MCWPIRGRCAGWPWNSARSPATCAAQHGTPRGPGRDRAARGAAGVVDHAGKVNPSIPEMVNQVCFQVTAVDATVAAACGAGQLELNVMMPVIAWNALHASRILRESMTVFRTRCVDGIVADAHDAGNCSNRAPPSRRRSARTSAMPQRPRSPRSRSGRGSRFEQIALERGVLSQDQIDRILAPDTMTRPGVPGRRTE